MMKYWLQTRTYSRRTYIKKYSIQINLKMHVFNLTKDELFQWYLLCVFLKATGSYFFGLILVKNNSTVFWSNSFKDWRYLKYLKNILQKPLPLTSQHVGSHSSCCNLQFDEKFSMKT